MFRIPIVTTVVLLAALAAAGAWAKDGQPKPATHEPGTLLVRFTDASAADAGISALGDREAGNVGEHVVVVKLHGGATVAGGLAAYRSRPDVVYVEPNYIATTDLAAPN